MCETGRQRTLRTLALKIMATQTDIRDIREVLGELKVKDTNVLDRLDAAMTEAAEYLAGELEAME